MPICACTTLWLTACRHHARRALFAFTTKARQSILRELRYQRGDAFLFGPESRGLPGGRAGHSPAGGAALRLPMLPDNRSLNLSNTVAVAVFEAWRQCGFEGAIRSLSVRAAEFDCWAHG